MSWEFQAKEKETGQKRAPQRVGEWKEKHINVDSLAGWFGEEKIMWVNREEYYVRSQN